MNQMTTESKAYETLRENVRELMTARGLTQMELAGRCGLRQSEISKLLSGVREPRLSTAQKFADALGISFQSLFETASEKVSA